jgi:hypothetical protein
MVDTVLFITISLLRAGHAADADHGRQIISKLVLSTIMVPPLIWVFVKLGRRLDGQAA